MATITANISASATLIPVSAEVDIGYYTIDDEAIYVTGMSRGAEGRDFVRRSASVDRAVGGTTAATHTSGATLTRYYPDAAASAGGEGAGVLEDPGEVFPTNTAVTEGFRIAETVQGELRVFEATSSGTTHPTATSINDFTVNLTPLGVTNSGDVDFRYLGIVGQLPWDVMPITEGLPDTWEVTAATGRLHIKFPGDPDEYEELLTVGDNDNGQDVWRQDSSGDSDQHFRDSGVSHKYRVKHDALNYELMKIGEDAILMESPGSIAHFRFVPATGGIHLDNLPTADPGVAGQLYSDGVPSAGVPKALMVSGG